MRILAVDPGEKRIGIAVSDPTGTIASPVTILTHKSHAEDAARIVALAVEHGCERVLIGIALNADGGETESSRRARNLAKAVRKAGDAPVITWDESGSTKAAQAVAREMGLPRAKRGGHRDAAAAAVILQSYLDTVDPGMGDPPIPPNT